MVRKYNYGVLDSEGYIIKWFETWKQAETFKIANSRYDWQIVERKNIIPHECNI